MKRARRYALVKDPLMLFCLAAWLLVGLMVVPVFTALAAGLAAVSLYVYGLLSIVLLTRAFRARGRRRAVAAGTCVLVIAAALVPQAAFLRVANNFDHDLSFDPIGYITFSGQTDLKPTKIVPYKTTRNHILKLAIYEPVPSEADRPAIVILHGGGWRYGNFLETGEWPRVLTEAGYVVISAEYRLSSDEYHTWQDAPADVHDAIIYLRQEAAQLGIDTERIDMLGQSAGGHLALLEAYRHESVRRVVALYPPADLELDYLTSRDKSAELDFVGGPPSQYPDRYRGLSPINYVGVNTPATLLIQGTSDDLVHPKNSQALADRLKRAMVPHELMLLPLTGHSFENQRGGFPTQLAFKQTIRFLMQ
jgi:acetyl esterase/lipase